MAGKTSPKTSPPLRTPEHGNGLLNVGNPGNRGGGRPPDEFKRLMRRMACDPHSIQKLKKILRDDEHNHHMKAREYVTSHGYDRPAQRHVVSGDETAPLVVKVVRE